jgi:hypothetical protein
MSLDLDPRYLHCLRWLAYLPAGQDHGRVPQEFVGWVDYLFREGLAEHGVGLACAGYRLTGKGRLTLQLLEKEEAAERDREEVRRAARPRGQAKAMRSAAKESQEAVDSPQDPKPDDLSKEAAHPVRLVGVDPDVVALFRPAAPHVSLTDDDFHILTILAEHGKAVPFAKIISASIKMNRDDPKKMKRLSDSTLRGRVPVMLERGLVARPPGTRKKGIAITDAGRKALESAAANSTETQRK